MFHHKPKDNTVRPAYVVSCPYCGYVHKMKWGLLTSIGLFPSEEKREYNCEKCGLLIKEDKFTEMAARGRWISIKCNETPLSMPSPVFCNNCKYFYKADLSIQYDQNECLHNNNVTIRKSPIEQRKVLSFSPDKKNANNNCLDYKPNMWQRIKNLFNK